MHGAMLLIPFQLPSGVSRTASALPLDAAGEGTGPSLFDSSGALPSLPNSALLARPVGLKVCLT